MDIVGVDRLLVFNYAGVDADEGSSENNQVHLTKNFRKYPCH